MAVLTHLETDTGTNVDISAATAVGAYTANADKLVMVDVSIDAVAGDGDYVMYITRQIGGSGSAYRILPQTTMTAASGLTAISGQSGWITVRNGDVLTCYVDGLAGDTSTPDWTTRWFESAVTLVTLADDAITASKFDESTAYPLKSADTGTTQVARVGADSDTLETLSDEIAAVKAETALILADTGTDGVKIAGTQGAITWGQQKIIANVFDEGALHIQNSHSQGIGLLNHGNIAQVNDGMSIGVLNEGGVIGFDSEIATASKLQTVDDNVDAVKAKTDNLPASPAAVGSAMTLTPAYDKAKDDVLTPLAVVDGVVDGLKTTLDNIHDTDLPAVKTETAAIKAKTDNLPAAPAQTGEYNAALTAIQADLDNPTQYKADVSGLATTAHVQEVENKIDAIDVTTVASMSKIDDLDAKVSAIDTDSLMQYLIDGYTFEQVVEILAAVLAGKLTRNGNTLTFRDLADTLDRLVVVTDNNKQRTDTTYTV